MSGPFTGVREGGSAPSSACFLLSSQGKAFALTYGLDTGERKGKKSSLEHLACLQIPHPLSIRATDCTPLQGYEPQTWEVGGQHPFCPHCHFKTVFTPLMLDFLWGSSNMARIPYAPF